MNRRQVMAGVTAALAIFTGAPALFAQENMMEEELPAYGLIGQMIATPGNRAALVAILRAGTQAMPGCFAYIVGEDRANADAIWIVELWSSADAHAASLQLPSVQAAIAAGRPLIAGFGQRIEFDPAVGPPAG